MSGLWRYRSDTCIARLPRRVLCTTRSLSKSPSGRGSWSIRGFFCLLFHPVSVRRTCTGCRWLSCAPCPAAPVHSQSPGWAGGAAAGWGGGAGFCVPLTRSGAGERERADLEGKGACGAGARLTLRGANTTGPCEGMNPGCSEPDSALSSSERRAPAPESPQPNSDLETWNRQNTSSTQQLLQLSKIH